MADFLSNGIGYFIQFMLDTGTEPQGTRVVTTEAIITLVVTSAVALVAGLLSSKLFERLLEQRQKVHLSVLALEAYDNGARTWSFRLTVNRMIADSLPVICFPSEIANQISGYATEGVGGTKKRVTLNDRGHLECDVAFLEAGQFIEVKCFLLKRGVLRFYSENKSLRLRLSERYTWNLSPQRYTIVAIWRWIWVVGVFTILAFVALAKMVLLWASA